MKKILVVVILLVAMVFSGCATNAQTGALVGGLVGAGGGSLIGANTGRGRDSRDRANTGALIGGLVGAAAGYAVGNEADKRQYREAYYEPREVCYEPRAYAQPRGYRSYRPEPNWQQFGQEPTRWETSSEYSAGIGGGRETYYREGGRTNVKYDAVSAARADAIRSAEARRTMDSLFRNVRRTRSGWPW